MEPESSTEVTYTISVGGQEGYPGASQSSGVGVWINHNGGHCNAAWNRFTVQGSDGTVLDALCINYNGNTPQNGPITCVRKNESNSKYASALSNYGWEAQAALWADQKGLISNPPYGYNMLTASDIASILSGGSGTVTVWKDSRQFFITMEVPEGGPGCEEGTGGGGCSVCNETCEDECSEGSCDGHCYDSCSVSCDSGCDGVCIQQCNDHCYLTCKLACAGCNNYCTACDQSCQNVCIVTCLNQCAACRTNCTGQGMSETECKKLCRSCTSMCIDTCVNSCITWNSGGTHTVNGATKYRSNATNNDWRGFTSQDAPRNGGLWYGPTTNGYGATSKTWTTIVNNFPTKPADKLPPGYGTSYSGPMPPAGVGKATGTRADYTSSDPGEQEWYHSDQRPDDDVDWDMNNNL